MTRLEVILAAARKAREVSPYYREAFSGLRLVSEQDALDLPLTEARDLQLRSKEFRVDVPAAVYASSGTTGRPKYAYFSAADHQRAYERTARALRSVGIGPSSTVAVAHGFGIWMIGVDYEMAALTAGATVVPIGKHPDLEHIVQLVADNGVTDLVTSPSFARRLGEAAPSIRSAGRIANLVLAGEIVTPMLRAHLSRMWVPAVVLSCYGAAELGTIGYETAPDRVRIATDAFVHEILAPDSGHPASSAEAGELVLTTIDREAQPLVRYRTGDVARAIGDEDIQLLGRLHEAVALESGEKLHSFQIDGLLSEFRSVTEYQLVVDEVPATGPWMKSRDRIRLRVVSEPRLTAAEARQLRARLRDVSIDVSASGLSLECEVDLVDLADLLQAPSGKMPRIVDRRQLNREADHS